MKANFWLQRWERGEISFHESHANPALVENLSSLDLEKGSRIFLPLCGKTLDIAWLLAQGHRIAGVELSPLAINELFISLNLTPAITPKGALTRYSAKNIDIWVGDIFDLSSSMLGTVDAIYDRAALVALPEELRCRYAAHLVSLTQKAPQLLVTFEYDQQSYEGPPFSVHKEELQRHYDETYQLELLAKSQIAGGLKGKVDAVIATWLIQRRSHRSKIK